jgi:hypothetical protein
MGTRSNNKKKRWIAGVDMAEFSGTSWRDLQDIWPQDVRVASEAWKIVSVFYPAWMRTMKFMDEQMGAHIHMRDFFILCWIHRCEEARANVATISWPILKGMNVGGNLWYRRQAQLTKLGLIESMPSGRLQSFRVTAKGKLVMKYFIDNVEQAHSNTKAWVAAQSEEWSEKYNRYFQRYCFDWDKIISVEPESPHDSSPEPKD